MVEENFEPSEMAQNSVVKGDSWELVLKDPGPILPTTYLSFGLELWSRAPLTRK